MSDDLRKFLDLGQSIKRDLDELADRRSAGPLPEVPEALRYILWRYSQDHTGEDHQERLRVATEWLRRFAKMPPQNNA